MRNGRWFIMGQLLFLTLPAALGVSIYLESIIGNGLLPFVALAPYMGLACVAQRFRCPQCQERPLSFRRASMMGYQKYITPRLWLHCPDCGCSFWRRDRSRP